MCYITVLHVMNFYEASEESECFLHLFTKDQCLMSYIDERFICGQPLALHNNLLGFQDILGFLWCFGGPPQVSSSMLLREDIVDQALAPSQVPSCETMPKWDVLQCFLDFAEAWNHGPSLLRVAFRASPPWHWCHRAFILSSGGKTIVSAVYLYVHLLNLPCISMCLWQFHSSMLALILKTWQTSGLNWIPETGDNCILYKRYILVQSGKCTYYYYHS